MKKKILVPVDLSPLSQMAFQLAARLATHLDSGITMLHVIPASGEVMVDITGNLIDSVDFDATAIRDAVEDSGKMMKEWSAGIPDVNIEILSRPGQTESVILQELNSGKYDLAVMGTNGATGLKEFFRGSHTEHIAMKSNVPVLCIKDSGNNLTKMVYASSFSDTMHLPPTLVTLCKALNVQVIFLHIRILSDATADESIYRNMYHTAKANEIKAEEMVIYPANDVEDGIETYCQENKIELLAIESKGRTGITKWVAGCLSADLINHSEHALLTFRITK